MPTTPENTPQSRPCPDPLTQVLTVDDLADLLDIKPPTLRGHIAAKTDWVPKPAGKINGGHVWRRADIDPMQIAEARRVQGRRRSYPTKADPATPPAPEPQP